ncbi:MAG: hypothetical protein KGJ12_07305 [Gammaproteobacteria bacterium]|nr:hypothetical protein [Gammaproteobacteria bacterium]
MSGHFPFLGKGVRYGGARLSIAAFFEKHNFRLELQEKYYRWWYEWTKNFVMNDKDLSVTKGREFNHYPYGQHAEHSFHLNQKKWCTAMADLGDLIRDVILPKLNEQQLHQLAHDHEAMLHALEQEATSKPRPPVPEVGYFRHV